MITRQVKFRNIDNDDAPITGGILIDDEYVICGCCGTVFNLKEHEVEILETYNGWADFSDFIMEE